LVLAVASAANAQSLPAIRLTPAQVQRSTFDASKIGSSGLAGPVLSVGVMTFTDADTLVIADWRAGQMHALQLPPVAA